jgi:UDP-N-acetylenolpyruvoylglucosamine reductase
MFETIVEILLICLKNNGELANLVEKEFDSNYYYRKSRFETKANLIMRLEFGINCNLNDTKFEVIEGMNREMNQFYFLREKVELKEIEREDEIWRYCLCKV